ncbi:hypothetical protein ACN27G_23310 [Plantactinospora sp. WMMB334]|uniref:hypothetical protein n=1 Tax=Plantactinospora sp. WMMB334 TaxID=3404119 RepID=UPI003B93CD35
MRFVTALVLMGLLLGAGGAGTALSPAGPAAAATPQPPAVVGSTVDAPPPGVQGAGREQALVADRPSAGVEQSTVTEGPALAGSVVPTVLVRAGLLVERPDRPVAGSAAGARQAGDAYVRATGPRAPPLR